MSDHGSNVSIEEIGPEDLVETLPNDNAEVLIPEVGTTGNPSEKAEPSTEEAPPENVTPAQGKPDESATKEAGDDQAAVAEPPAVEPIEIVEEVPRAPQPNPAQSRTVATRAEEDEEEEDDDDIDETITERLIGLTEMFPESLTNGALSLVKNSWAGTKYLYGFGRSAAWIFFSTASILFMPVMIETERLSIMDQQKQQKTHMLLGPGVASNGPPSLGPPPI